MSLVIVKIRASWVPRHKKVRYYIGGGSRNGKYIGSSWVDKNGKFNKSEELRLFCQRNSI